MQKIVTGIDIGSYHVKVVIAEHPDDPRQLPRILGVGYAESRGLRSGYIVSVPDVARSIAAATAQASKAAQQKVRRVYLSIGGIGLEETFARGETVVERGDSEITERDIARALDTSEAAVPPATLVNRKIIHRIPLHYTIDGVKLLGRSPIGMKGTRLATEAIFITCLTQHVNDLVAAVEEAGMEVEDVVAAPIAASFVALSKTQKRVGSVLANIGSETLSIIVFEDSMPISIKVFPVGSTDITNDLALGLRIPPEEAEQLKQGAVFGSPYPKRKIDDLISKRVSDMFKLIDAHLKKIKKDELLPGGIILTGGGSSLQTVSDLAKAVLRLPSRVASLTDNSTSQLQIKDGSWAVAYGLTVWGFTQGGELEQPSDSSFGELFSGIWGWVKKFLP